MSDTGGDQPPERSDGAPGGSSDQHGDASGPLSSPGAYPGGPGGGPARVGHDGTASSGYPHPRAASGPAETATPEPEGFFETLVGVITDPADTLRRVTHHPKIGWAFAVLVGVAVLNGLVGAGQLEAQLVAEPELREFLPPEVEGLGAGAWTVLTLVMTLVGAAIGAFVVHLAAKLISGTGTYGGQFSGFGIAYFPMAFGIVAGVLGTIATGMAALGSLISLALTIWVLVLGVIATRENHGFSTGHAVGAVAIGAVLLVVGVVIIAIVIALIVIGLFAAILS